MSILTDEQTKEIINGAMDQIKESVIDEAIRNVKWHVQDAVSSNVKKIVTDFVKEEVMPELLVSLTNNKSVIIDAAILSAETMAQELADGMTKALVENLGSSYSRKKIFEALFD